MSRLFRAPNRRLADLWSQKANYFLVLIPMVYYRRKPLDRVSRPNRTRKLPPGARNGHHFGKAAETLGSGVARVVRFGPHPVDSGSKRPAPARKRAGGTGIKSSDSRVRNPHARPSRFAGPEGKHTEQYETATIQRFPNCELGAAESGRDFVSGVAARGELTVSTGP